MAIKTLNALTYQTAIVTDALGDTFYINPFDSNGNLVQEMIIEVESSLAFAVVYLPPIYSLNTKLTISNRRYIGEKNLFEFIDGLILKISYS
jgi:hypothetical protein